MSYDDPDYVIQGIYKGGPYGGTVAETDGSNDIVDASTRHSP